MNVTETERLILANQYKILAELTSEKRDGSKELYNQLFEVFNSGYTSEFDNVKNTGDYFVYDEDILDSKAQIEVHDLISMYQYLLNSYQSAKEEYEDLPEIRFVGYDLNSEYEAKKLSFMNYIFDTLERYPDVKNAFDKQSERNSHGNTHIHDDMLAKYVEVKSNEDFYKESTKYVKQILDEQ